MNAAGLVVLGLFLIVVGVSLLKWSYGRDFVLFIMMLIFISLPLIISGIACFAIADIVIKVAEKESKNPKVIIV